MGAYIFLSNVVTVVCRVFLIDEKIPRFGGLNDEFDDEPKAPIGASALPN